MCGITSQLDALKSVFNKLAVCWEQDDSVDAKQRELLALIQTVGTFDELYGHFKANYTINSEGSLAAYSSDTYDLIISFHVMEHVDRNSIEQSIGHMCRMLKPGGYCIHQIGVDDHLVHYDSKVSKKNYMRYSLSERKYLFENIVQYHNVLQGADYLRYFGNAGFDLMEIDREYCDIAGINIHADWAGYSQEDQETTIFTIVAANLYDTMRHRA